MKLRTGERVLLLAIAFSLLGGTSAIAGQGDSSQAGAAGSGPEAAAPHAGLKVVLLRPAIRIEDVKSGEWRNFGVPQFGTTHSKPIPNGASEYERVLMDAAKSAVAPNTTIQERDTLDAAAAELCQELESLGSRLARGNVNESASIALTRLAASDEHYAVLAQFLRLQTGPGKAWNPNTGAIASASDSTLLQSALVEAKTGRVLWKNEHLTRYKALRPSDGGFSKALRELYKNFEIH